MAKSKRRCVVDLRRNPKLPKLDSKFNIKKFVKQVKVKLLKLAYQSYKKMIGSERKYIILSRALKSIDNNKFIKKVTDILQTSPNGFSDFVEVIKSKLIEEPVSSLRRRVCNVSRNKNFLLNSTSFNTGFLELDESGKLKCSLRARKINNLRSSSHQRNRLSRIELMDNTESLTKPKIENKFVLFSKHHKK
jgi:hypothetical protein